MTAQVTAHVIADDAEALAVVAALADEFRAGAAERDAERRLPRAELDRLSASGLLAVTVPAEHGGADVSARTLAEAAEFVRTKSRPWFESGVETAAEDPLLIQRFGELSVQVRASEALLREAARMVDAAGAGLTDDMAAEASVAVAAAKVHAAQKAVEVACALFVVSGTRSALHDLNLHRHWRDARTHTLHDPARWKLQHIGRYTLDGTRPPRHGLL